MQVVELDVSQFKREEQERYLSQYLRLKQEKLVLLARRDPDSFINYTMAYGSPVTGPGEWFPPLETIIVNGEEIALTCQMHRDWQEAITNHDWVYIEGPREHAKTSRIAGRIIWELGKNPNIRIKYIGQNDEKPSEVVTMISHHILQNPRVQAVFPDLVPDEFGSWAKHKIFVKRNVIGKDASLEGSGVLATGVGGRADWLIFDDPVDFKNAIQFPALRETVKKAYKDVWINLLPSRGGRVTYICTPWHREDLSHEIKQKFNKRYFILSTPIDKQLNPVWQNKWDHSNLEQRRDEIGSRAFDRGFHLKALSDEDQLFKMVHFTRCFDTSIRLGQVTGGAEAARADGWRFFTGVDLGSSRKQGAARTSIFTFGVKKDYRIPVEIKVGRFGETDKLKQIYETYIRFRPEIVAVENNSYQETTINLMKEINLKVPVRGLYTGSQKMDLTEGLPSLALEIENNMWTWPAKGHEDIIEGTTTRECSCPVCQLIDEATSWPIGLSDMLMSWWIAREGMRSLKGITKSLIRVITAKPSKSSSGEKVDGWSRSVLVGDEDEDD